MHQKLIKKTYKNILIWVVKLVILITESFLFFLCLAAFGLFPNEVPPPFAFARTHNPALLQTLCIAIFLLAHLMFMPLRSGLTKFCKHANFSNKLNFHEVFHYYKSFKLFFAAILASLAVLGKNILIFVLYETPPVYLFLFFCIKAQQTSGFWPLLFMGLALVCFILFMFSTALLVKKFFFKQRRRQFAKYFPAAQIKFLQSKILLKTQGANKKNGEYI